MSGVTVICPNSRRCLIKVTPATHLRRVLEEACLKQGFDIDSHELKHQNRVLDAALPFRLSGLPNNATIEMIAVTSATGPVNVEIALQMTDGTRKLRSLSNDQNLVDVLKTFSEDFGQDLVNCDQGSIPVCAYMNKTYRGEAELSITTLKTMGISSGRSLIRYGVQQVSEDELNRIATRLREELAQKEKLFAGFEAKKAENERREEVDRQREQEFDRQRRVEEAKARKAVEQRKTKEHCSTSRDGESTTLSSSSSEETSNETVTTTTASDTIHTAVQQRSQSRLHKLQSLLGHVNTSLNSQREDFLAEHLLADNGRIPLSQLPLEPPTNAIDFAAAAHGTAHEPVPLHSTTTHPRVCTTKCDRKARVVVRDAECSPTTSNNLSSNIDDKFFELSVKDAQSLQRDLREQVRAHEQRALLPREFVAQRNRELKEAAYKHAVIRLQLDDKTTIQALFLSAEPVSHVYEFISECLDDHSTRFELCFALNQKIANDADKHLIDAGIAPASTVFVKFNKETTDYGSLFSKKAFSDSTHEEANEISKQWLSTNGHYDRYDPRVTEESRTAQTVAKRASDAQFATDDAAARRRQPSPSGTKPKWFKKM